MNDDMSSEQFMDDLGDGFIRYASVIQILPSIGHLYSIGVWVGED